MKKPLIPGQCRRHSISECKRDCEHESILPVLFKVEELPIESHEQWMYIEVHEMEFRNILLSKVGEHHEPDVSEKTFKGLHVRLQKGPVVKIRPYAFKAFDFAARKFKVDLAEQRRRELLIGDNDWILIDAPQEVPGYVGERGGDPVETSVADKQSMQRWRQVLEDELPPSQLVAFTLVALDGLTPKQVSEVLGVKASTVRVATHTARNKLRHPSVLERLELDPAVLRRLGLI